jgi:hypothetical protein
MPTQHAQPVPRPRRRRHPAESRSPDLAHLTPDVSESARPLPSIRSRPALLSPDAVLRLQRAVGNRAACSLLNRRRVTSAPRVSTPPGANVISRWSVDDLYRKNETLYRQLKAMMLPGPITSKDDNDRKLLLRSLAVRTESADALLNLLKSGFNAKELDQALQVAGDMPKLQALSQTFTGLPPKTIVLLTSVADDYKTLIDLAPLVKPAKTLYEELQKSGTTNRAKNLKEAVDLAGSYAELVQFKPLSDDKVHLLKLLKAVGKAKLAAFVPIAKDAATMLELLDETDADNLRTVMAGKPKADLATLRPLVIKSEVTKGPRVDPMRIRFTQATCTNQGDGYTVDGNIAKLKSTPAWDIPGPPIRVFQKTKAMNAWGGSDTDFGYADPANLEDDQIYSLDNRRLVAYQRAGRQIPAPAFVPIPTVKAEKWKFTTKDQGRTIVNK